MQNFPSEEEKKKLKLISEYQKALSYLNVDLKKLNTNQLKAFSNEELENKITNAYQLIAMSKNLTDEMYQKFVRGDYSPKIHDIVINTLLSDYPFDVELFKLCLTDNVEDLEIYDIYSKINSAKEVVKHLRDSNKPSYTMSLEQQRELPSDEENEKVISSILKNRYSDIEMQIEYVLKHANEKGLTK